MGTIFTAIALIIIARWFFRSQLSVAVAEQIRARSGAARADPAVAETMERLTAEVTALREEVVDLGERLDFAERLLIEVRRREGLPEPRVQQ